MTSITSDELNDTFVPTADEFSIGNYGMHKDHQGTNRNINYLEDDPMSPPNSTHLDLTADYITRVANSIGLGITNTHEVNIIVVLPSIDFDEIELQRISKVVGFYEERQLYHLFLLQDPSYHVVYLSSHPISEEIIRYFVSLNCTYEDEIDERLSRLSLLTVGNDNNDSAYKSLSTKVYQSRELVPVIAREIHRFMHSTKSVYKAGLSVFTGSPNADQLAQLLDLRLLEAGAQSIYFGTKQGR
jgi:hypothetical protein